MNLRPFMSFHGHSMSIGPFIFYPVLLVFALQISTRFRTRMCSIVFQPRRVFFGVVATESQLSLPKMQTSCGSGAGVMLALLVLGSFCSLVLFHMDWPGMSGTFELLQVQDVRGSNENLESESKNLGFKVFLGIFSRPENLQMRQIWRNECGKQLQAAGINYKFIMGWPVDENRSLSVHKWGVLATDWEVRQALQLRNESTVYKDLYFSHFPDAYASQQSKTFALFSYGYSLGASYVVKMDDDICLDASMLLLKLAEHEHYARKGGSSALYAGHQLISWTKGRDGLSPPYYSGQCYVLSSDLLRLILVEDETNALLWAPYGSFDEDAETGHWVAFAIKQHNITVHWMGWDETIMKNATR